MSEASIELEQLLDGVSTMSDQIVDSDVPVLGDRRDGRVYAYTDEIVLAIKVALITARPLLLTGPPGCGKSSLASYVARNLDLAYFEYVADGESIPQDLLWRVDLIRRLSDAQRGEVRSDGNAEKSLLDYIEPGPLWWALSPETARRRGRSESTMREQEAKPISPPTYIPDYVAGRSGAVLLIDEIDKADNAFCNGLLVPLGSKQFNIPEADITVTQAKQAPACSPLVMITSNDEKELPAAFMRRCISLVIPQPTTDQLINAAKLHFPILERSEDHLRRVSEIAQRFEVGSEDTPRRSGKSTAEFLDLVATMVTMDADLDSDQWRQIENLVLIKPTGPALLSARGSR